MRALALTAVICVFGCSGNVESERADACRVAKPAWERMTGDTSISSVAVSPTDGQIAMIVSKDLHDRQLVRASPSGEELSRVPTDWASWLTFGTNGDLFTIGSFEQTLTLGSITLTAEPWGSAVVAQLDASGNVVWAKSLVDTHLDATRSRLVPTADGGLTLLTRRHDDTYDAADPEFGTFQLHRLDRAGNELWRKQLGDAETQVLIRALDVDSASNVVVTGSVFRGSIELGSERIDAGDDERSFVLKLGDDGSYRWHRRELVENVRVGQEGTIYLASAMALDAESAKSVSTVTRLDGDGALLWDFRSDFGGEPYGTYLALNDERGAFALTNIEVSGGDFRSQIVVVDRDAERSSTFRPDADQIVTAVHDIPENGFLLVGVRDPSPPFTPHRAFLSVWQCN